MSARWSKGTGADGHDDAKTALTMLLPTQSEVRGCARKVGTCLQLRKARDASKRTRAKQSTFHIKSRR